ncbi:hypothetical protein CDAR_487451 [Caerostris darwini]|uniref:C2H2-type domain-containing protein n=1 Tax=Caerostris darwini TaxID=1538125 RepID=A0AAV4TP64_9ARAC|nr:hypothetical protein CDAR_487451 [Caerostris darwini]
MEITKCEYCKAYVTNFEVHNCVKIGNHHRQTSSTLPQCSSGNLIEDIELITAEEMEYEAWWPSTSQSNYSTQQSFLFDLHQQTDCEETAASEKYFRYGISNHDQNNPAIKIILDFHFPSKPSVEENEYKSVNLQQSFEPSKVLRSQNSQPSDTSNPWHPASIPTSLSEQGILHGFQQTFGQRIALMNRMDHHLKDSSQIEYSGTTPTKQLSYNTRNLSHPTNITQQTEPFSFTTLTCDDQLQNLPFSINSLSSNSEENILSISKSKNPNNITDTISLPSSPRILVENGESRVINLDAMKCRVVERNSKDKQWTEFSYGLTNSGSCTRNSNQTHLQNFGIGIKNTELYTSENSSSVSGSSERQRVCNISTTTRENESNAIHKNYLDTNFSRNVNSSKNLNTPSGNTRNQLYKCSKDHITSLPSNHLTFAERSRNVARSYKCNFCDKTYSTSSNLRRHVRSHTGDKPYQCTECGKSFDDRHRLRDHNNTHTGEKPYSCGDCGKCFGNSGSLTLHIRTHTRKKPYACSKCSKRYSTNFSLKRHMLKHVDEHRRKCDSCGAEFSSEESLEAHQCGKNK